MRVKIETKLKTLTKTQRSDLHERAGWDEALLLWELAVVTGYSYATVLLWKREGLPVIDGKITKQAALAWRISFLKEQGPRLPASEVSHLIPAILQ